MQESKLMARNRMWLAIVLSLAGCRPNRALPDLLPETAAGGWRRTSLHELPVSEARDPIPRTSVKRLETAVYEGPGKVDVRVYELSSNGVALDLVQRWRPSADTVFVNHGNFFLVLKWEHSDRGALRSLILELEKNLER